MKIGIIGGGASGLMAAVTAAGMGSEVTVLERNDKIGKKILSTGNGKCNFSNRDMDFNHYYCEMPDIPVKILDAFTTGNAVSFFEDAGMLTKSKNGYLYPYSEQASTVVDTFRNLLTHYHVQVITGCMIKKIQPQKNGKIRLSSPDKDYCFDRVIVACGGMASPKTGSDGNGYELLRKIGHHITPVVPALVQLKCAENYLKSVAGVRMECSIALMVQGKEVSKEYGEIQLTDYGISGIVTFQLSRIASYAIQRKEKVFVYIDFFPDWTEENFSKMKEKRNKNISHSCTAEEYFTGMLPKKLMLLFLKLSGISPQTDRKNISEKQMQSFYALCRKFPLTVTGTNSFDQAQVCAGGIPFSEVTKDLLSKKCTNLYITGELLDIDGKCGGYNLHWAWASGYTAGKAAAGKEN